VPQIAEKQAITLLLGEFADGDKKALDQLMPLVYIELKKLARGALRREHGAHTLQPTALVHEAYAHMIGQQQPNFKNRAHFLSVVAKMMRQILIDDARRRKASKRGGGLLNLAIEDAYAAVERPFAMLALASALDTLERKDSRKARLIEMRYFGGLTLEESSEAAVISADIVRYKLRVAQAWLHRELSRTASSTPV